ncbi:MAG TPA: IclR family transcriptional regulator [Leifsonia sp.]|nr:IclR family transcriptional regulator [Leifsonia sp.]
MGAEDAADRGTAPAVTRAVAILGLLADAHGAPMSLSEIARALGIAKSSTSNLCVALEEGGMVQRSDLGYTLGRRNVELGGAFLRSFDQVREFYKICSESPVLSHELLQIAVLDGVDVLYLARHEGHAPLRLSATIGDRFPAALTAIGNALLANLTPAELVERYRDVEEWPRLTEKSVQTFEGLEQKIAATRKRGYSLDEGEVFPSVIGVAMLIPPRSSGDVPLAMGASMFRSADSPKRRERVIDALHSAVAALANPMIVSL